MKQSKRIAVNTLTSWGGMFANVMVIVFLTKYLLGRLGTEGYGMFRYVITILESLMVLDLGLGATLNRFVSQLLVSGDLGKLRSVVSLVFFLFLGLGFAGGLAICGLGFALPRLIEGGTTELYHSGLYMMVFIAGTFVVRFVGYTPRGILFGLQRYDLVNANQLVAALLRAASIAFLLYCWPKADLAVIGLSYLGSALLETGVLWVMARRYFGDVRVGINKVTADVAQEVLGFSAFVTVIGVTTMLISNAPTFLVGKFYGLEAVAYLSLPLLIIGQLQRLSGGFAFTLIPVAGKYHAQANGEMLQAVMVRGTRLCALTCFPVGALAVVFGYPLFEWFREGFGWTWELLGILMIPYLFRTTQRVAFSVLMGAGSVKWLSVAQVATVAFILFFSWLCGEYFSLGIRGVVLGTAVPILILGIFFQPIYACHQLNLKWFHYMVVSYGKALLCTLVSTVTGIGLIRWFYPRTLTMIGIEFIVCMVLFGLVAWRYALGDSERSQIAGLFGSRFTAKLRADDNAD